MQSGFPKSRSRVMINPGLCLVLFFLVTNRMSEVTGRTLLFSAQTNSYLLCGSVRYVVLSHKAAQKVLILF